MPYKFQWQNEMEDNLSGPGFVSISPHCNDIYCYKWPIYNKSIIEKMADIKKRIDTFKNTLPL